MVELLDIHAEFVEDKEKCMEDIINIFLNAIEYEKKDAYKNWSSIFIREDNSKFYFSAYRVLSVQGHRVLWVELIKSFGIPCFENVTINSIKKATDMKSFDFKIDDSIFVGVDYIKEYIKEYLEEML